MKPHVAIHNLSFLDRVTKIHIFACFGAAFLALHVAIVRALPLSYLLGSKVGAAIVPTSTLLYTWYGLVCTPTIAFLVAPQCTQSRKRTCIALAPVSGSLMVPFGISPELASNLNVKHL